MNAYLKEIAEKCKALGYKVAYPAKENYNWFHVGNDNGGVAYIQTYQGGGFSISSEHKPIKGFGTGSRYKDGLDDITKEDIEKAFTFIVVDHTNRKYGRPEFYKGIDEVVEKSWTELIYL
jgi:hypothetical protein